MGDYYYAVTNYTGGEIDVSRSVVMIMSHEMIRCGIYAYTVRVFELVQHYAYI